MSLRHELLDTALGELGVREKRGREHEQRVLEYLSATLLASRPAGQKDETAWCSAFVCWVAEQVGAAHPESAWARSWLGAGVAVVMPLPGDVAIFSRGPSSGHVGFWLADRDGWVPTLGGNQSGLGWTRRGAVCVKRQRASRLLGVRRLVPA